MTIHVNRILNLKKIKAIGFDMDYTLVRYNAEAFEKDTHKEVLSKLVAVKGYPSEIKNLDFDYNSVIQGLVMDRKRGNLLKLSRFGKVKSATHGTLPMPFKILQSIYSNCVIDLNDPNIQSLDTAFSISHGVLFGQLVDMKDQGLALPSYTEMSEDIKGMIDYAHSDGSLKGLVRKNLKKYIVIDPEVALLLERYKRYGKKLWVITNSDYNYTNLLLSYTIDPYLKEHKNWRELFDLTVTLSSKPGFFTTKNAFLKIDPETELMSNHFGPVTEGIYQGGSAEKLQKDIGFEGDEILYLGDHIYGDVVTIKKTFNWRTGLVLEPLAEEVSALSQSEEIQKSIDALMIQKEELETKINEIDLRKHEEGEEVSKKELNHLFAQMDKLNHNIATKLEDYQKFFNPHWGAMMRAGQEESRFADQVEKYACIYMPKVSDLNDYSPRTYFRPLKRVLPHESFEKLLTQPHA